MNLLDPNVINKTMQDINAINAKAIEEQHEEENDGCWNCVSRITGGVDGNRCGIHDAEIEDLNDKCEDWH